MCLLIFTVNMYCELMVQVAVLNNRGMNKKGYGRPTILALSRQGVPNLPGTSKEGVEKGGYIVHGGDEKPDAIILATGKPSPMLLTDCSQPNKHIFLSLCCTNCCCYVACIPHVCCAHGWCPNSEPGIPMLSSR